MTLKEMREKEMTKAIKKYATISEAAKVLNISEKTLYTHKQKFKL
jgi:DNA-binding CsgD family transcriptional regulator|tara:strand:+ start:1040 stop:1174 length:135 start_codon:yes stop_codon:yes gene_type:complete